MNHIDIQRCCKKTGDKSRCAKIATFQVTVENKYKLSYQSFRCDKHKTKATAGTKVLGYVEYDQSDQIDKCLSFLKSLVNKRVSSKFNPVMMTVRFVKTDKLAVMAQEDSGKWRIIYPNQISV